MSFSEGLERVLLKKNFGKTLHADRVVETQLMHVTKTRISRVGGWDWIPHPRIYLLGGFLPLDLARSGQQGQQKHEISHRNYS
jgi:hypothetical protein